MKKSIIILSILALMLVCVLPVMSMGLAEDMIKSGYILPGYESLVEESSLLSDAADFIRANYDKSTSGPIMSLVTSNEDIRSLWVIQAV